MDDDVASLHGVVASDSGYTTSSASRPHACRKSRSHSTAKSSTSTAATSTGSLNARLDRLSREMEEVAEATSNGSTEGAGRSLGIKRKKIAHRPSERVELGGIEGLSASSGRAKQVDEEKSLPKRRRSLGPRQPPARRRRSKSHETLEDEEQAEDDDPPIWLSRIISPHSGQKRTVAVAREETELKDTPSYLGAPMEMPSFMREKQTIPQPAPRFSPKPDWLARYLAGTPAPPPLPPSMAPPPAQPVRGVTPVPSASSSLLLPPFEEDIYEPPPRPAGTFSAAMYPPQQQQQRQLQPAPQTPLPFSTSGRFAQPASQASLFAPPPHDALYESQLARPQLACYRDEATPPHDFRSPAHHVLDHAPPAAAFAELPYATGYRTTLAPSPTFSRSPAWTNEPSYDAAQQQQPQQAPRREYAYGARPAAVPSPHLFPFPSSSPAGLLFERPPSHGYAVEAAYPHLARWGVTSGDANAALEPHTPASSSFWRRPAVPQLGAGVEQGQRTAPPPGQLRFAQRLEEEAASQFARAPAGADEDLDLDPSLTQEHDHPSAASAAHSRSTTPFRPLRTPSRPHPAPSRSLSRASSRGTLIAECATEDVASENRLPSPSLYRFHPPPPPPPPATSKTPPQNLVAVVAVAEEAAEERDGVASPPRLSRSRTAQLRDEERGGGAGGRGGREGTPSPGGSPMEVVGEGHALKGVSRPERGEEGVRQEGEEEEEVKFDWDVVGEGQRLLDAVWTEQTEGQERAMGNDEGMGDAFDFYEDPEDLVEE